MDSDTHSALIDQKSAVRIENLRISGDGDDGAAKNMRGSKVVSDYSEGGEMSVVGMYEGLKNKLYYLLAMPNGKSKLIEYDVVTETSRIIIQDNIVLRFDLVRWNNGELIFPLKYILGINQIGDLLIISNESWQFPRMINLKRVDDYALGFTEDDISLAKKPPKLAPAILSKMPSTSLIDKEDANKFVSFSYRYKYKDGDFSSLSFYSDSPFIPDSKEFDVGNDRENKSMVNRFQSLTLTINTGDKNVTDIEVYAREHGSNTAYLIYNTNKKNNNLGNNSQIPLDYNYSTNYEVLNEEDTKLLYNNTPMFPKTQDSAGSRMIFGNYKEGFDLKNSLSEDFFIDYEVEILSSVPNIENRKTIVSLLKNKVGVQYSTDHNISTTVLLPQNQSKSEKSVDFDKRLMANQLQVKFPENYKHPTFATKMKFVVISDSLNYENLYITYARKIGLKTYLLLNGDNVQRVRKDDVITRVDIDAATKIDYKVLEVKEYGIDDGLVQKGFYVLIETDEKFKLESNGDKITKEYDKYWAVIDSVWGTSNPDRFDATSGFSGVYETNPYSSYENRGKILNSDFGAIKEGDSLTLNIDFTYGRDKRNRGESATTISGTVSISEKIYASTNYDSIGDFIKKNLVNPYIKVDISGNEVNLLTNNLYPDLVKEKGGWIYEWQSYAASPNERAVVKVKTYTSLVRGIKPIIFRTKNQELLNKFYFPTTKTYLLTDGKAVPDLVSGGKDIFDIGFYNGFSWGNGLESYKIRDEFNAKKLQFNFGGNLVEPNGYKRIHRKNDITFSGIFNYELGFNRLSNFNPSVVNWKTIAIKYDEIQRIISTDGDISVFFTNKVASVLYGKSLIMDLRGNESVALSNEVLGDVNILDFENGISLCPESLAKNGNIIYFNDKYRARFLIKTGDQIQEINAQGGGFFREGVEVIKNNSSFLGAFDDAHGEYVCALDNKKSLVFNLTHKGFVQYYTHEIDYHLGMSGKFFTAFKGRIYENFVSGDYNIIAGQEVINKIVYVTNIEIDSDKIFKALYLHSNVAWNVDIRTNYTETKIPETQFKKKESFFYSDINRNLKGNHTSSGVGVVNKIEGNKLIFLTEVPIDIAIGDYLQSENGDDEFEIIDISENSISVFGSFNIQPDEYVFANRKHTEGYRPDGEPIRGKYMEVTLWKKTNEEIMITSVTTEIVKSNL